MKVLKIFIMLNQEEQDKQVREVLGGHTVVPPQDVWTNVEGKLPKRGKIRPFLLFFMIPAAICVAALVGYFSFMNNSQGKGEKGDAVTINSIESKPKPQTDQSQLKPQKDNKLLAPTQNENIERAVAMDKPVMKGPAKAVNTKYKGNSGKPPGKAKLYGPLILKDLAMDNIDKGSNLVANALNDRVKMNMLLPKPGNVDNKTSDLNLLPVRYIERPSAKKIVLRPSHWQLGLIYISGAGFISSAEPGAFVNVTQITSRQKKDSTKSYIITDVATTSYKYKCISSLEFSFGLMVKYNLTSHLFLGTGFIYKGITQKYAPDNGSPSQPGYYQRPLSSSAFPGSEYDYSYRYLTIPIELQYQFNTSHRLGYYVNAGGAWNNLLKVNSGNGTEIFRNGKTASTSLAGYGYQVDTYTALPFSTSGPFNGFSANFGGGLSYLLSERFTLQAGVSLNYMISGISADNKNNLLGIEIPVGLFYKF
jgi:hypothetical protein